MQLDVGEEGEDAEAGSGMCGALRGSARAGKRWKRKAARRAAACVGAINCREWRWPAADGNGELSRRLVVGVQRSPMASGSREAGDSKPPERAVSDSFPSRHVPEVPGRGRASEFQAAPPRLKSREHGRGYTANAVQLV
jgi:hypothetical protein